jgi:UDP-N-acetylglucosamine--N-acetylmuramyl-(pentapeptide) pyrophosphoryl-undecaprenol N-acetylglucosamine transferase
MIKESDLDTTFEREFLSVFESEEKRERLSKNIKALALPNATKDICDEIEKLLN